MIKAPKDRLDRFLQDERGVASIEFVIVFPVVFAIFLMAFESGMMMTRAVMFERAVDIVMEDLMLQKIADPDADKLRELICDNSVILAHCKEDLKINLTPVSTTTWDIKSQKMQCIDRKATINPLEVVNVTGEPNELMLIRVCLMVDALFPTTGLGLRYEAKAPSGTTTGALYLTMVSAFMNEPVEK